MYSIYCIDCVREHACYIGQTRRGVEERYDEHWATSRRAQYQHYPLYAAFLRYGKSAFHVRCLKEIETAEEANIYEVYYIAKYKSGRTMYNQLGGGGYKSTSKPLVVRLFDFHTLECVQEFPSYWDAAKELHTSVAEVIVTSIDFLPLGRHYITFGVKEIELLNKWQKCPVFKESYWLDNYGEKAMKEKKRRGMNPDAYTYTSAPWAMVHW